MLSNLVRSGHPCFQVALRTFAYTPRVPSGATGEPLSISELKVMGMNNLQKTKVLNYAEIIPQNSGEKNQQTTFMPFD